MTRLMRPGLHMERTTHWRPHLRLRHDQRDLGTGARAVSSGLKQGRLQTVRVSVTDGSGDINVRNVTGSFTVESDGSGNIYASDVRGSVIVKNDGSGGIEVNKVGRDFKVESKGSGSIEYTAVSGQVDIPER
jgi:DUF4097 and DUF4098 domain-containing protein YvlB